MSQCPCCGQPLAPEAPLSVDLDRNVAIFQGNAINLTRQQAEILSVVVEKAPSVARYDTVISRVWGLREPDSARGILKVQQVYLNKRLAAWGLRVKSIYGEGIYLEQQAAA